MQGQNLHEHNTLDGQAEEMLWKHDVRMFPVTKLSTHYTKFYILCSVDGFPGETRPIGKYIMQITNAGDKSAEVSAPEEGCGTSREQHLLVCTC